MSNDHYPVNWIIGILKIPFLPILAIIEYTRKKRALKALREPYKHLYLPKREFEHRFPQYKRAKKRYSQKTTI